MLRHLLLCFVFFLSFNDNSWADTLQNKPIKLIVPFSVGGPPDIVGRIISEKLSEEMNLPIVIENRVGASGNIGTNFVITSLPDGHTLLLTSSSIITNTIFVPNTKYDIEKDFTHIIELAETPSVFVIKKDLNIKSLSDFLILAKNNKYSYAHSGLGTISHLVSFSIFRKNNVNIAAVSLNGSGPAVQMILSNNVEFCAASLPALSQYISNNDLIGVASTHSERLKEITDVPTIKELGYGELSKSNFIALFGPPQMNQTLVSTIQQKVSKVLNNKDIIDKLEKASFFITNKDSVYLKNRLTQETLLWKKIFIQ